MPDWTVVADLGTAGGTLVLAVATFASVRSANQSARVAERSLLEGLRPLVLPSRLEDPGEKVGFVDDHWVHVQGGRGHAEATREAVYFALALRNVGQGLAILNAWRFQSERLVGDVERPAVEQFRRLTRDLYIPPGDRGFWQGALRDPAETIFDEARQSIRRRQACTLDLLYGDGEGGQRVITRFTLIPSQQDDTWLSSVSRHWNLDRADPR